MLHSQFLKYAFAACFVAFGAVTFVTFVTSYF